MAGTKRTTTFSPGIQRSFRRFRSNHSDTSSKRPSQPEQRLKVPNEDAHVTTAHCEKKKKLKPRRMSFKTYIHKTLKTVHRGVTISTKAMDIMNELVNDVFDNLATEAFRLAMYNKKRTLTSREIKASGNLMLSGNLAKCTIAEGDKALTKFFEAKVAVSADRH